MTRRTGASQAEFGHRVVTWVRAWPPRHLGLLVAAAVGLIVLSPWLWGMTYLLHYDLVFVPHLPLSPATLGLDGDVPRAVPNDVVVALLSTILPGWCVERLVLLGCFCLIGAGVDRWSVPPVARVVSAVALTWNPWIGERLGIGHWGYLWGYAGLVWVVVGALDLRRAEPRADGAASAGTSIGVGLVVGSVSGSTGGVLVGVAALVLLGWPGPTRPRVRTLLSGALWWLALNAAWWFAFLTLAPSDAADAAGVGAFAARADSPAGLWASLASGGGIWHTSSWFTARSTGWLVLVAALLCTAGLVLLARVTRGACGWAVLVLALAGLGVSGASGLPGGDTAVSWFVLHVPGGGLLRDGQKFVALWLVPAALGAGFGIDAVRRRATGTVLAPMALLAGIVVPIATLPGLAWCKQNTWRGVSYPAEFAAVADDLAAHHDAGVAVFPWQLYRQYAWNDHVVVLDPWQRLVPNRVLVDDDLPLGHLVVRGESKNARAVTTALERHDTAAVTAALRAAGVRYVVEQVDQPTGAGRAPTVGRVVHAGPALEVRDLGAGAPGQRVPWWAGAGLASTALAVAGAVLVATRRRGT